jgi:hypothetical protein
MTFAQTQFLIGREAAADLLSFYFISYRMNQKAPASAPYLHMDTSANHQSELAPRMTFAQPQSLIGREAVADLLSFYFNSCPTRETFLK